MKTEIREDGINLIPESKFEIDALRFLRKEIVCRMHFEDDWEQKGKLIIEFDKDWGR